MNLSEAKKAANEILCEDSHLSYRNVWGFFGDPDQQIRAVFITKDGADTEVNGIFLDKGNENGFVEYKTGRIVSIESVFGKRFFDDDPSLFIDHTPQSIPMETRIEALLQENTELLIQHGLPFGALVMLRGIIDDGEDAVILLRLVVLRNYLSKTDKRISTEEFAFMHQELFRM